MELSLPAGNFDCAIVAFENGADSVYFGLKYFSARAVGENFDIDDYRRLREYSLKNNKKIYIAFNTILNDNELKKAFYLLKIIDFIGIDGLIVQDWGVVNLVKKYFSNIPLHASTQMAIQNTEGVKVLKALGFKRAVLARELSLKEIKDIKENTSDIELKVFIHGAMCYSISGLCNASRFLIKKGSANKGTCRQVCRMNFTNKENNAVSPFSMCDLISDKKIIDTLKSYGIESVKVEGRLKGSVYVKFASRYYRLLIDGKSEKDAEGAKERMQIAFSRLTSSGYFYPENGKNDNITIKGYCAHRGIKIATCVADDEFLFEKPMRLHDGIMLLKTNHINSNLDEYKISKRSSPYKFVEKGDVVKIKFDMLHAEKGDELYKIKDSRDNEIKINKDAYELYRKPILIYVEINADNIELHCNVFKLDISEKYEYKATQALKEQDLYKNFHGAFSRNSNWFKLKDIKINNNSAFKNPFIPLSFIKKIAIDFYKVADEMLGKYLSATISDNQDSKALPPACKNSVKADVRLEPFCFGKKGPNASCFTDNVIEINNISQIFSVIDSSSGCIEVDKRIKGIVLGQYMNISNAEGLDFFKSIFKDKLLDYKPSFEIEDNNEDRKDFPLFIHRIQSGNGILNVKIRSENGNSGSTKSFIS